MPEQQQKEILSNKNVVVTGGTGSLGKVLVRRLLGGELGVPARIVVFSRDEAKQHAMRLTYVPRRHAPTDEVIYDNFRRLVQFVIGDVRDIHSVTGVLRSADVVFNAAALKQVPTCEYFPYEAVLTNITGPQNIIRAIQEYAIPIDTVIGISTDKACHPVNVMGMTKALQERVFLAANLTCPDTRFACVRYGNVLASRGSVIPLFREQILGGGPVTITTEGMTRFLLSLEQAVDTVFAALVGARPGELYIPRASSARIVDVAKVLIGDRDVATEVIGIRPGEKIHEILVSHAEAPRAFERDGYYVIQPMVPELQVETPDAAYRTTAFSSGDDPLSLDGVRKLLTREKLLLEDARADVHGELLR